jgi:hypothetical protein
MSKNDSGNIKDYDKIEENPKRPEGFSYISAFDLSDAKDTGGVTGSKKVTIDDDNYQLKPSVLSSNIFRQLKEGWLDSSNIGELISSNLSSSIDQSYEIDKAELIPKILLVYDDSKKQIGIASKYLKGVQGTLDEYAEEQNVKITGKHVHISINKDGENILNIGDKPQLVKDLAYCISLSALSGDHDINPGNMIIVKDNNNNDRIARIDFGHAFNDLVKYTNKFSTKNINNDILDFFNKESIDSLPLGGIPKLWRDYSGIVPSRELAESLKEVGQVSNKTIKEGLKNSKESIAELIKNLEKISPKPIETIVHIKESLIAINDKISNEKIDGGNLKYKIEKVFKNLESFYEKNQEQMVGVGKLMNMQLDIDQMIKMEKSDNKETEKIDKLWSNIKKEFQDIRNIQGRQGDGITWVKNDKNSEAFIGTLRDFIKIREKAINLEEARKIGGLLKNSGMSSEEGEAVVLRDSIKSADKNKNRSM